MNKRFWVYAAFAALLLPTLPAQVTKSPKVADSSGDFFIVSSIDLAKQQILLKFPTEVTELMRVDASTRYFDDRGTPIRLQDLRSGDTVYITPQRRGDQPFALTIRKGPMTLEILRERYLGAKK